MAKKKGCWVINVNNHGNFAFILWLSFHIVPVINADKLIKSSD